MKMKRPFAGIIIVIALGVLAVLIVMANLTLVTGLNKSQENTEAQEAQRVTSQAHELFWMHGCWQTADGATREVWRIGANTHMFGHSLTTKEGAVAFFENLNLIKTETGYTLSAYPMGEGPSDFPSVARGDQSITFENTAHDYPQRIVYSREGNTLTGTISLADGAKPNSWVYGKCGG